MSINNKNKRKSTEETSNGIAKVIKVDENLPLTLVDM